MKKVNVIALIAAGLLTCSGVLAYAAEKSDSFIILEKSIRETEPVKEGQQYYIASDEKGYDWHGVFDNEGNMIALASTVYDRGDANEIADEFGVEIYYKIPMKYRDGDDFYQVIVPVYDDTKLEILCARPLNLYDKGYKVTESWDLPHDGNVVILRTNLTPSYMVRLSSGDSTGYIRWSDDWYPEEANAWKGKNMDIPLPE